MKKLLLISILALVVAGAAISGGVIRLIVPTLDDISSFTAQEGELAYDDSRGQLKVYMNGAFEDLSTMNEDLPLVVGRGATISIKEGSAIINKKMYRNTSAIVCDLNVSGAGGVDSTIVWSYDTKWVYLYLIPDANDTNFNCIVSSNSNGPVGESNWIRLNTFSRVGSANIGFTSKNGRTSYTGESGVFFAITTVGGATCAQALMGLPLNVETYKLYFSTSTTLIQNEIYDNSSCLSYNQYLRTDPIVVEMVNNDGSFYLTSHTDGKVFFLQFSEHSEKIVRSN